MLGLKWLRDDEGEGEKGHLRFEEEVWGKKNRNQTACLEGKNVAESKLVFHVKGNS